MKYGVIPAELFRKEAEYEALASDPQQLRPECLLLERIENGIHSVWRLCNASTSRRCPRYVLLAYIIYCETNITS